MIDGMKVTFPINHAIIKQAHFFRKHMTYFKVITYLSLLTSGSHHLSYPGPATVQMGVEFC